jgi:excisionase family DNA binding protein
MTTPSLTTNLTQLLTREQAAAYLGVAPQTLSAWAAHKRYDLPLVKLGRLVRYRQRDLDEWLEKRTKR